MDQVLETIKRAHQGDKAARDRLVQENMPLVWSIVRRFSNRGYEPEDLFQIGSIGLLKAIDRFDTAYEVKFSTYAVPLIIGEIRRYLRDDGMLKVQSFSEGDCVESSKGRSRLAEYGGAGANTGRTLRKDRHPEGRNCAVVGSKYRSGLSAPVDSGQSGERNHIGRTDL